MKQNVIPLYTGGVRQMRVGLWCARLVVWCAAFVLRVGVWLANASIRRLRYRCNRGCWKEFPELPLITRAVIKLPHIEVGP